MLLVSSCSCLCPIHWSQVLSREWRCSWSSADLMMPYNATEIEHLLFKVWVASYYQPRWLTEPTMNQCEWGWCAIKIKIKHLRYGKSFEICNNVWCILVFSCMGQQGTKTYDVTIPKHTQKLNTVKCIFCSGGFKILYEISNVPFEISHKFWNQTPQNMHFTRC